MKLNNHEKTDYKLISQIKQGEDKAFTILVNRWYKRIYNYAYRYKNDDSFAQEIVQKTFIQLYQKVDQLKDERKFKPWFYRIAHNLCVSEGRSISRKKKWMFSTDKLPNIIDAVNQQSICEKNEKSRLVSQALESIPEEQKQVIILKEYEGLKFREIAETLGESESTIKSRMYYGLDAMRKILMKQQWTKELYYD